MAYGTLKDIVLKGIVAALPDNKVETISGASKFGDSTIRKLIDTTGVQSTYRVLPKQTVSDLCFSAAEKLISDIGWKRESIDALIFVSHAPDYDRPATACVLHGRLGLSNRCLAFDVGMGCSGFIYGLTTIGLYMQQAGIKRGVLLTGDMSSLAVNPETTNNMIFGDCGCAIALEKQNCEENINFLLKTDGKRYKDIFSPGGGYRHRGYSDKFVRMEGNNVFSFSITDVIMTIKEFMSEYGISKDECGLFVLHQANALIIKTIAKKCRISEDKVPISIYKYGNTASSSIPLSIVDAIENYEWKSDKVNVLASGFGLGLSWGVVNFTLNKEMYMTKIMTKTFLMMATMRRE